MRFIYHPDNIIYLNSINYTIEEFIKKYPAVPLIEGQYFSYIDNIFNIINLEGHNILPDNLESYSNLIEEIEKL